MISSNVLGSAYGSTCAASVIPATGRTWGQDFPFIPMEDEVYARARLDWFLGITRLKAVAGCSLGSFQAYQWAVNFPDMMDKIIATDTAAHDSFDLAARIPGLLKRFSNSPVCNHGEPAPGALVEELAALRVETLVGFGILEKLALIQSDRALCDQLLQVEARACAQVFDPWTLISMYRTAASFDVRDRLKDIRAPVLIVMADTDEWYSPDVGRALAALLRANGVDVTYHDVRSNLGHYSTTEEPEKCVPVAREFLDRAPTVKTRRSPHFSHVSSTLFRSEGLKDPALQTRHG